MRLAHPADDATIAAMHHATFDAQAVPLIDAIRPHRAGPCRRPAARRPGTALRELPVIAIRKYAYEHALAIFGDIEGADHDAFEECCDRIAALHGGLNETICARWPLPAGGDGDDLLQVLADLDRLTLLERGIKATVGQWFDRWQRARA